MIKLYFAFLATLTFVSAAHAQDTQPVFSEPYEVSDARQAMDNVRARWQAAQAEQMERYSKHKGTLEEFVRNDPVLQDVSWPYGTCTDMLSLIPPPLEGWGLRSSRPFPKNPIGEEQAEISYVTYDATGRERSVTINLTSAAVSVEALESMLSNEMMRDAAFDKGPYNHPIGKYGSGALIGNVVVNISGTGEQPAAEYLSAMIKCAINSGFLAKGIDPGTLRNDP